MIVINIIMVIELWRLSLQSSLALGGNKKFPATLKSLSMQLSPLLLVRYHDAISFPLTLFHQQEHLVFLTRLLNLIFKGPHLGLNVIN